MPLYIYTADKFDPSAGTVHVDAPAATIDRFTVAGTDLTDSQTLKLYAYQDFGLTYDFSATLTDATGAAGVFTHAGQVFLIASAPLPAETDLVVSPDAGDATFFPVLEAVCFAPGTRIVTPDGEVAVEALAVGDLVLCTHPGFGPRRVTWTGAQRHFIRTPDQQPVRIRAGALGAGIPQRDLVVSPAHALALEGHLVRAALLVNGASILHDTAVRQITWHHVEVEGHAILIANGAPAETYLDTGNRHVFSLPGLAPADAGDAEAYRARACLPVLEHGPVLDLIRVRLLARARGLYGLVTSDDPRPQLRLASGRLLDPDAEGGFLLPAGSWVAPPQLVTRSGVPAALVEGATDTRRLGVALAGLELCQGTRSLRIEATDLAFSQIAGLRELEWDGERPFRWTSGAVALPATLFEGFDGTRPLRLRADIIQRLPRYVAAA